MKKTEWYKYPTIQPKEDGYYPEVETTNGQILCLYYCTRNETFFNPLTEEKFDVIQWRDWNWDLS